MKLRSTIAAVVLSLMGLGLGMLIRQGHDLTVDSCRSDVRPTDKALIYYLEKKNADANS